MSDDNHPDGEVSIGREAEFVDTSGNSKVKQRLPLEVDMDPDRPREDIPNQSGALAPGMFDLGRKHRHLEPRMGANRNGSDTGCRCLPIRKCVDSHLGLQSKWYDLERPVTGRERPRRHIWVWSNDDRGPEFGRPLALSLESSHGHLPGGGGGHFELNVFGTQSPANNAPDNRTRSPEVMDRI